jgi:hypothetical protein
MRLKNFLKSNSKIISYLGAFCGILSITGFTFNVPEYYNSLISYEKLNLLLIITWIFIAVIFVYLNNKIDSLSSNQ